MFDMDVLLSFVIAISILISCLIALDKRNHYSIYTTVLKIFPRAVLGFAFLIAPFLHDDIQLMFMGDIYSLSDHVRVILWMILVYFWSEICIQYLNVRYGRAEEK